MEVVQTDGVEYRRHMRLTFDRRERGNAEKVGRQVSALAALIGRSASWRTEQMFGGLQLEKVNKGQ